MTNDLPLTFERDLYRAVIRFKQDHPGVLEARTQERRCKNGTVDRSCKGTSARYGSGALSAKPTKAERAQYPLVKSES